MRLLSWPRFILCSEVLGECVIELFHGDLAVTVVVETSHQRVLFVVCHMDSQTKKIVNWKEMEPF